MITDTFTAFFVGMGAGLALGIIFSAVLAAIKQGVEFMDDYEQEIEAALLIPFAYQADPDLWDENN